jgi:hypothetical protein
MICNVSLLNIHSRATSEKEVRFVRHCIPSCEVVQQDILRRQTVKFKNFGMIQGSPLQCSLMSITKIVDVAGMLIFRGQGAIS